MHCTWQWLGSVLACMSYVFKIVDKLSHRHDVAVSSKLSIVFSHYDNSSILTTILQKSIKITSILNQSFTKSLTIVEH